MGTDDNDVNAVSGDGFEQIAGVRSGRDHLQATIAPQGIGQQLCVDAGIIRNQHANAVLLGNMVEGHGSSKATLDTQAAKRLPGRHIKRKLRCPQKQPQRGHGSLIPGEKRGTLPGSLLGEERLQLYLPTMQPNDYKPQSTGKPVGLAIRLMWFAYIAPESCNLSPYEIAYGQT
jgi:hypothetical protein